MYSLRILIFAAAWVAEATHFLGGTITWRPLNASATGSPVDIVITQTYSWSFSIAACTSSMIATNQLVPLTGWQSVTTHRLTCSWNCGASAGGYTAQQVAPYCTDFSAPAGTTVGQRSDIVRLNAGANFSASYQNIFWRNLTTGTDEPWSISTYINLAPRADNGLYNNAPVGTVMSPIYIVKGQPTIIHIPVADADGDTLRCRWAKSTNGIDECGGICPPASLPNGTVIFPNCTMIITGPDVGNWFAAAITVEDFINASSTTPLSSAPVQFLIQVIAPPTCNITPVIVGSPQEGSCMAVTVGQSITSDLIAINSCGSTVNITDISTLSFPGVLKGNLVRWNSTTYSKSITWTPTSSQLGYQLMCAMALNSENAQSSQFCFTFYVTTVSGASCPGFPTTTSTSTTTITVANNITTDTQTTETTSTTSTMATNSTTASTIASTSTSSTTKTTNISWPLIGTIGGLFLLASIIFLSCLSWRFCCGSCRDNRIGYSAIKPIFYHIEQCQDSHCQQNQYYRSAVRSNGESTINMNDFSRSSFRLIPSSRLFGDRKSDILNSPVAASKIPQRHSTHFSMAANRIWPIQIETSHSSFGELLNSSMVSSNRASDRRNENEKAIQRKSGSNSNTFSKICITRVHSDGAKSATKKVKTHSIRSHSQSQFSIRVKRVSKSNIKSDSH